MGMERSHDLFWERLQPEYQQALMFCRKLMGDRDKGDDLFQDGLVIALTRFSDLRQLDSFRPWLYKVLVTTFQSTIRRPWWRRQVTSGGELERMATAVNPLDVLTARRWLNKAFRAVSPGDQALITLYELEGWTTGELADLYSRSEGAIRVRLSRIRKKMKKALAGLVDRSAKGGRQPVALKQEK